LGVRVRGRGRRAEVAIGQLGDWRIGWTLGDEVFGVERRWGSNGGGLTNKGPT
jgi:hypothetical protein